MSKIVFIYLVFFPFITFGLVQSDISPLVLAILFLQLIYTKFYSPGAIVKFSLSFSALIFVAVCCVLLEFLLRNPDIRLIKLGASLFIVAFISEILRSSRYINLSDKTIFYVCLVWFITGILSLINTEIFSFLLFRTGVDSSRGAIGLTPEPSYYGLCSAGLLFISFNWIKFSGNSRNKLLLLSVILSFSSVLISLSLFAFIVVGISVFFINKKFFFFIIIGLFLTISVTSNSDLRLITLSSNIFNNPNAFLEDISIFLRVNSIFSAMDIGMFRSFGGTYFSENVNVANSGILKYVDINSNLISDTDALYGGLTILILRYGWIGLFFAFLIVCAFIPLHSKKLYQGIKFRPATLAILPIIVFIGPIGLPPLLIAYFMPIRKD